MNEPQNQLNTGDDAPKLSIEDLIKVNVMQKMLAEATINCLQQAKADREELDMYRAREVHRLKRQNEDLK